MDMKWIGFLLIVFGCGGYGFAIAASHKSEMRSLRQLLTALDYMQCELQYHLTPLPDLCRQAGRDNRSKIDKILICISEQLDQNLSPDVKHSVDAALRSVTGIPERSVQAFELMGRSLGRFDAQGQIQGLESVRVYCRSELHNLEADADVRLRSYQTLGICAGAALAILFV